jgi:2-keto-4-pentenoate hydratase/2-oxohepta-3-ene-1,7-dioic acid hydratase (catechol pathway)
MSAIHLSFFRSPPAQSFRTARWCLIPLQRTIFSSRSSLWPLGRGGSDIPVGAAETHIFGYAIGIDLTRRDLQRDAAKRGLPWEMGKSFDHSAPCGPIHRIETTGKIRKGAISLSVNGTVRQRGDIGQMIWNVPEIIAQLSSQYELCPGDIILTGTPAGVGPLVPGDVVECSIEGLGTFSIRIGPKLRETA